MTPTKVWQEDCTQATAVLLAYIDVVLRTSNYTRRVKDGPSIIYMAKIQGVMRDVWGEEQRRQEKNRWNMCSEK